MSPRTIRVAVATRDRAGRRGAAGRDVLFGHVRKIEEMRKRAVLPAG